MPRFELLPVNEAMLKSASGKRAQITREYMAYIERLGPGQAGRLQVAEGEGIGAIRRRLGAAATMAKKDLVIKRGDNEIYFWVKGQEAPKRRGRPPGRPPKQAN